MLLSQDGWKLDKPNLLLSIYCSKINILRKDIYINGLIKASSEGKLIIL